MLLSPHAAMLAVFMAFGCYFAARGLRGEAIGAAMMPIAFYPTSIGLSASFALTTAVARRRGLRLRDLGWTRPSATDIGLGVAVAVGFAALDQLLLHPLVRLGQPTFDPTLPAIGLVQLVGVQLIGAAAEDTLFRGYALRVFSRRYSTGVAAAIGAVSYASFSAANGWPVVAWALGFGAVLAVLAVWRRNLWAVATAHVLVALAPRLLSLA